MSSTVWAITIAAGIVILLCYWLNKRKAEDPPIHIVVEDTPIEIKEEHLADIPVTAVIKAKLRTVVKKKTAAKKVNRG